MKKITIVVLCIALLAAITLTSVFATAGSAELAASVSTAQPGDTVEFMVSVENFPEADSLSVTVTVPDGLAIQSGEWVLAGGFMSDYMPAMKMGVWTSTSNVDLSAKTDIFKLTCVVNEPAVGQQDLSNEVQILVGVKASGSSKGQLNASAQVAVYKPATELTLNKETLQLDLSGIKTEQLTATVNPENTTQTLSWVSGNNGVATVSADGTVTAVAEGEAVITATVGALEKSCTVTVICGHSQKTEHPADLSTCQTNGNNLYYTCDTCGDAFKADGTTETTVQAETLPLANHQGGTASCSQQANCQWCSQPYGDTLPHTFTEQIEDAAHFVNGSGGDCQKAKQYYYDCADCDAISPDLTFDSNTYGEHQVSTQWTNENDTHFYKCTVSGCTYKEQEGACTGGSATCQEKAVCTTCQNSYGQLAQCRFTEMNPVQKHLFKPATCQEQALYYYSCEMCDATGTDTFPYGNLADHDFTEQIEDAAHFVTGTGVDCQNAKQYYYDCADCDAISPNKTFNSNTYGAHQVSSDWTTESNKHFRKCTVSGCTYKEDEESCSGGSATCTAKAVCATCQQEYGVLLDHDYSQQWTSTGTGDTDKHYRLCTSCLVAKDEEAVHSFQWVEDAPASEDNTGLKHEECSCGVKRSEGTEIPLLPHQHIGVTHYPAVAATCQNTGTVEYWTCASHKCTGKYYGDAAGTVELTTTVTEIDSNNHIHTEIRDQLAANCYKDGYAGDTWCLDCGVMAVEGETIEATGNHVAGTQWHTDENDHWHTCTTEGCTALVGKAAHSYQWKVDTAATEDTTGIKHEECVCGVKRSEGTVIEKLDHVHIGITHHAAVKATCVSTGTVEYWTCASSKCTGKYFGDAACQVEITALTEAVNKDNHAGLYVVDQVAATCSKTGYTGDTWCSKCKILVKKGEVTLATGAHTAAGDYMSDKDQHWNVCACGEHIDQGAHTAQLVDAKEATQTQPGYTGDEVCSVCGYVVKKGEEIPVVTEPDPTEPTEPAADVDTSEDSRKGWVAPVVIASALAVAGVILILAKKRNYNR